MFCKATSINREHVTELLKAGVIYRKVCVRKRKNSKPIIDGIFQLKYRESKPMSPLFDKGEPQDTIDLIYRELKKGNIYFRIES